MTLLALPQTCPRCGGGFHREPHREGTEWTCIRCGHVRYDEGFQPFGQLPDNHSRGARHGGRRLT